MTRSLLTTAGLVLALPVVALNLVGVVVLVAAGFALTGVAFLVIGVGSVFWFAADWLSGRSKAITKWAKAQAGQADG